MKKSIDVGDEDALLAMEQALLGTIEVQVPGRERGVTFWAEVCVNGDGSGTGATAGEPLGLLYDEWELEFKDRKRLAAALRKIADWLDQLKPPSKSNMKRLADARKVVYKL